MYRIENYVASCSVLTIFVNLTLVEVPLILSMLRYSTAFENMGITV